MALAQQPSNTIPPKPGGVATDVSRDQSLLFAQAQNDLFDIPSVMDRPLGMEEGPRIMVSDFSLSGAVDREEQDLRISDIRAMLGSHVQSQPADGFTINQLQAVADEVTQFYRDRGFLIAQAIIPAQEVRGGVVDIQVLEGLLEDIEVEGNRIYRTTVVGRPFRNLQGQPVVQDSIEQALLDIQGFPGLTVFGTFTEGDQLGNTDLVVRVQEERRLYVTPSIDNYGSEFTGEFRGLLNFEFNNLFGIADQMSGYILQTIDPANGTYGGLNFNFPIGRSAIGLGASTNAFDIGGADIGQALDVNGTVDQADIYWDKTFANGRFFKASGRIGVAVKNALTETIDQVQSEDELSVVSAVFEFFAASRRGRGFTVGSIQVDAGIPDWLGSMDEFGNLDEFGTGQSSRVGSVGDEFVNAGGKFTKYKFDLQHLRRISTNNSLLIRLDGQWTDDLLVALEQYAIGGPQNVRAYPVAERLVDSGGSATLEWIINAPGFADKMTAGGRSWGEIFQVSLYADYAYGEVNHPFASQEPTVDYSGYGLGLQFNVPQKFYARFDVASPIGSRIPSNDRDPQYYFRLSYTF